MLTLADTADHPPPPHHQRSQSSIQFSHADTLFSKLRSKDSSIINTRNPSFRVYYNQSTASVPFKWETTPGTPKQALFEYDDADRYVVRPLTPPPSFFKIGSGRESEGIRGGSRNVIGGCLMRMKTRISHSSWSSNESVSSESSADVDRKAPLRNWRSLSAVRFSMRFGKGRS